jgi:hypothetical protein
MHSRLLEVHHGRADAIVFHSYDLDDERRREALFALGNGMLSVRACAPEATADDHHYPGRFFFIPAASSSGMPSWHPRASPRSRA